jgi:hypothetical protein
MRFAKFFLVLNLVFVFVIIFLPLGESIQPSGANVTEGSSSSATPDPPGSAQAQAGNVTELNLQGFSVTRSWQGYYGNVTGTITLGNSAGDVFYNWSVANPRGEVYASTNNTIQWQYAQCFNYTASGTFDDDTGNAGGTSQFGLNLTQLEEMFNIPEDAVDGVDETFNIIGEGGHREFFTGSLQFEEGQCWSTELFDSTGGPNGHFQQALLYEPETSSLIFTSLIEQSVAGFDGNLYDFQMLVLDDGRAGNTDTTTYYFYIELE